MICASCQQTNHQDARFCQNCGQPLSQSCPDCNTTNEAIANFCKNCGARLNPGSHAIQPVSGSDPRVSTGQQPAQPASPAGEKRMLTVLFVDVVDSTSLAEELDVEDWTGIMNRAFEHMAGPIQQYGGTVSRLLGDALLATFGAPVAHEDDPVRAAFAALDILKNIEAFARGIKTEHGIDFAIRGGINTGLAVVGDIGGDRLHEYTAMGDAVNLAARIQSAADRMTVWVSGHTYRFISAVFDCRELGEMTFKGKSEPVEVFEILKPRQKAKSQRGVAGMTSPMVGRQSELDTLLQLSDAVQAGLGHAALIVGEAGIGKTRLVQEWRRTAGQQVIWVEGSCLSYGHSIPYHMVTSLLGDLLQLSVATSESDACSRLQQTIDEIAPENSGEITPYLANLLSLPIDPARREHLNALEPKDLQQGTINALRQIMLAFAEHEKLVIILEDIHWADHSSAALFSELVSIVQQAPILLCLITRPEQDSPGWTLVNTARDTLRAGLKEINLQPLTFQESSQLVANLLAVEALPEDTREMIFNKAEGYPLFFEEVIRMLVDQGVIDREDGGWRVQIELNRLEIPDNLQGLLLARIDRLAEEIRSILRIAAVAGRRFSINLLELVLERSSLEQQAAELAPHLSKLEMGGFIQLDATQPEIIYRFQHSLIQEAVYASLLKVEQRRIHQAIGEAMEILYHNQHQHHAALLAYHFSSAGDDQRALKYHRLAADTAARQFAAAEALEHYTSALHIAQRVDHPHADIYNARGSMYEMLGRFEEATRDMQAGLQAAREADDRACELQILLNLGYAWSARDYNRTGKYYQQALALARRLEDPRSLAQSLIRLGNLHTNLDRQPEAVPYYQEALETFQKLGDQGGIAETYDLLGMNAFLDGDTEKGRIFQARAESIYRQTSNLTGLASILTTRAIGYTYYEVGPVHMEYTPYENALDNLEEALNICQQINWRAGQAYTKMVLAQLYAASGDIQHALETVDEGLLVASDIGHLQWLTACTLVKGMIHKEILAFNQAKQLLESALEIARETSSAHWTRLVSAELASVLIESGEADRAEQLLEAVINPREPARSLGQRDVWCKRIELALAQGDMQSAIEGIEFLDSWAKNKMTSPAPIYVGMLHGRVLSRQRNWLQAKDKFQAVLQISDKLGFPGIGWRCCNELANIASVRGDARQVESYHQQAKTLIGTIAGNIPQGPLRETFVEETEKIQNRSVTEWQSQ